MESSIILTQVLLQQYTLPIFGYRFCHQKLYLSDTFHILFHKKDMTHMFRIQYQIDNRILHLLSAL